MRRDELPELHYITPIANVPSILAHGLLSHRRVAKIPHESIAMEDVQDRRSNVKLPTGRWLHEYVNLYINARNAMMYLRKDLHERLCVIRIRTEVLDVAGTVITDRNAASTPIFSEPATGLARLNKSEVYARYWTHPGDPVATANHKTIMCAEALIPDRVGPEYIAGAYVSCVEGKESLLAASNQLAVQISGHLSFQPGGW